MSDTKTIVIIGGTGHFGGRISRRIAEEPNIAIIVTSRRQSKADRFVRDLQRQFPRADICPAGLDQTSANFADDLERLNPDIVLHTAGPYQGQDYRVAKACIDCKSHYIDLADGRAFVEGFDCLDSDARNADVLLVTGASTLPGLSSAVIDSLKGRFRRIEKIQISIAPAHQTPRGPGTIAAVLSYCGKPFSVLSSGQWVQKYGWQDLRIQKYPDLGRRLSCACDVPDLGLMPKYFDGLRTATFHAALEEPWELLSLWLMAWLTRFRIVDDWARFAPTFQRISDRLIGFGSDTGGMHIRLSGTHAAHGKLACSWFLTAGSNHGPEIPCCPALVLARKLARNIITRRGAYPCMNLITLSEFDEEVRDMDISWRVVE